MEMGTRDGSEGAYSQSSLNNCLQLSMIHGRKRKGSEMAQLVIKTYDPSSIPRTYKRKNILSEVVSDLHMHTWKHIK